MCALSDWQHWPISGRRQVGTDDEAACGPCIVAKWRRYIEDGLVAVDRLSSSCWPASGRLLKVEEIYDTARPWRQQQRRRRRLCWSGFLPDSPRQDFVAGWLFGRPIHTQDFNVALLFYVCYGLLSAGINNNSADKKRMGFLKRPCRLSFLSICPADNRSPSRWLVYIPLLDPRPHFQPTPGSMLWSFVSKPTTPRHLLWE